MVENKALITVAIFSKIIKLNRCFDFLIRPSIKVELWAKFKI